MADPVLAHNIESKLVLADTITVATAAMKSKILSHGKEAPPEDQLHGNRAETATPEAAAAAAAAAAVEALLHPGHPLIVAAETAIAATIQADMVQPHHHHQADLLLGINHHRRVKAMAATVAIPAVMATLLEGMDKRRAFLRHHRLVWACLIQAMALQAALLHLLPRVTHPLLL